jgi:hypothetical protein
MIARRQVVIFCLASVCLVPWAFAGPKNYLLGTFHLKCPYCGKVDVVENGTAQHHCENRACGKQVFVDGKILVMCPKGHTNEVILRGETRSIKCKVCNVECEGNWK